MQANMKQRYRELVLDYRTELRAGRVGKDGFVFVNSSTSQQQIQSRQIQVEKLLRQFQKPKP